MNADMGLGSLQVFAYYVYQFICGRVTATTTLLSALCP